MLWRPKKKRRHRALLAHKIAWSKWHFFRCRRGRFGDFVYFVPAAINYTPITLVAAALRWLVALTMIPWGGLHGPRLFHFWRMVCHPRRDMKSETNRSFQVFSTMVFPLFSQPCWSVRPAGAIGPLWFIEFFGFRIFTERCRNRNIVLNFGGWAFAFRFITGF